MKSSYSKKTLLYLSLLIIFTFIIYIPSFKGAFVFDDYPNIVNNNDTLLKNFSISSIIKALSSTHGGLRPFAHLSFAINYYLFGLNPFIYHMVNFFMHILNSILVFFLVKDVGKKLLDNDDIWLPYVSSILFAITTIQTSAVSYIVQRMALGMTLFSLIALLMFVKKRYMFSFIFWLIALGFKENAVLIPFIALLFLWIEQNKSKIVLGVSFIVIVLVAMLFLFSPMLDFYDKIVSGYQQRYFTLGERLLTEPRVVIHYFSLVLFPLFSRFSLHYGFALSTSFFNPFSTFLSIVILSSLIIYSVFTKNKWISFWVLFIFIGLFLESSIIPLDIAYEHRMYFPMIGVSALFGYFVKNYKKNKVFIVFVALFLLFSGVNTFLRNMQYKSYETILTQDFKNYPNNPRMLHNLSAINLQKQKFNKSYFYLCKSLENNSFFYNDYTDFAELLDKKCGTNSAINYLKNVLKSDVMVNKRYLIYWKLARLYEKINDIKQAERNYLFALKLQGKSLKVFRDFGLLLFNNGFKKQGYQLIKKAHELNKYDRDIIYYLAKMSKILQIKEDEEKYIKKYNEINK